MSEHTYRTYGDLIACHHCGHEPDQQHAPCPGAHGFPMHDMHGTSCSLCDGDRCVYAPSERSSPASRLDAASPSWWPRSDDPRIARWAK